MTKAIRRVAAGVVRNMSEHGRGNVATLSSPWVLVWCPVGIAGAVALDLAFQTTGYVLLGIALVGTSLAIRQLDEASTSVRRSDERRRKEAS